MIVIMSTAITAGIIGDDTNVLTGVEGEGFIQATALTRMAYDAVTIMTVETASNSALSIPGLIHVTLTYISLLGHRRPHPLSNPPTYCNPHPNTALSTRDKAVCTMRVFTPSGSVLHILRYLIGSLHYFSASFREGNHSFDRGTIRYISWNFNSYVQYAYNSALAPLVPSLTFGLFCSSNNTHFVVCLIFFFF